jgi:hypothetical protein
MQLEMVQRKYIPDKDLFLPVDILQKLFNFFIVKTTQTFHKGINFILKDPIIANYYPLNERNIYANIRKPGKQNLVGSVTVIVA